MNDATAARTAEVEAVLADVTRWACDRDDVHGLVLVGSYARGRTRPDSDVDLVVLSPAWRALADDVAWFPRLRPGAERVRAGTWGPVLERRWRLPSGLEVELGLTGPEWAQVPLDPGTAGVLRDGCRVLHDPRGLLALAVAALEPARP